MKKTTIFLAVIALFFANLLVGNNVYAADPPPPVIGKPTQPTYIDTNPNAVNNYIPTIMNGFFFIGIIALLAYLVYGGVKWIMSGGDPKASMAARDTLIHAIVGFILLSISYAIATIFNSFVGGTISPRTMPPLEGQGEFCVVGDPNFACRNPIHACVSGTCQCADPRVCTGPI